MADEGQWTMDNGQWQRLISFSLWTNGEADILQPVDQWTMARLISFRQNDPGQA
jgi:hypothetical protein